MARRLEVVDKAPYASNSPAFTPRRNASHSLRLNTSSPPARSLLSRTRIRPSRIPTSTQTGLLTLLNDDFRNGASAHLSIVMGLSSGGSDKGSIGQGGVPVKTLEDVSILRGQCRGRVSRLWR